MVPFENFELKQLPKEANSHVNAIANIASTFHLAGKMLIPVELLKERSINHATSLLFEPDEDSWVTSTGKYIVNRACPKDNSEARKLKMRT